MNCSKCGGRMLIDRTYSTDRMFDVYCMSCGKRVFVNRETTAFGKWLSKREREFSKLSAL
jgi:hypothetical protein